MSNRCMTSGTILSEFGESARGRLALERPCVITRFFNGVKKRGVMKNHLLSIITLISIFGVAHAADWSISPSSKNIVKAGGSFSINISNPTSDVLEYWAGTDVDWITIAPRNNLLSTTVNVAVDANNNHIYSRTGYVTVSAYLYGQTHNAVNSKGYRRCYVTQSGQGASFSPASINFNGTDSCCEVAVNVSSGISWEMYTSSDWVTLDVVSGTGSNVVHVCANANETGEERTTTIKIYDYGVGNGAPYSFTVTQAALPDRHSITYNNTKGAVNPNPATYTEGDAFEFAPLGDIVGYSFVKWEPSLITAANTSDMSTSAIWSPVSYTVSYDANGGNGSSYDYVAVYDEEFAICESCFTKDNHEFLGWSLFSDGDVLYNPNDIVSNLTASANEVVTLYAVWGELLAAPKITPSDGYIFWGDTCEISISCPTMGAEIYYSTNGAAPKVSSTCRYNGSFLISETTTIRAVAVMGSEKVYSTAVIYKSAESLTLERATGATDEISITTDVSSGWIAEADETADEGVSARSGKIEDAEESWLQAEFCGAGTFSFKYKVSCEHEDAGTFTWDSIRVFVDGEEQTEWRMDGQTEWVTRTIDFSFASSHTVRLVYHKDESNSEGSDCAWVSAFTWNAKPVPTGFEIVGADSLLAGGATNYLARLIYSNGTSVLAESVSWNVSDSAVAEVDAEGAVAAGKSAGNVVLSASCTVDGKEWTAAKQIEVLANPTALSIEVDQELICPGWTVEVVFTVTYADGTSKRVLPTAFVEGDATLDEDGFLTIGDTSGEVRVYARYSENGSGLLGAAETFYVREPISVNEAIGENSLTYISGGNTSWQVDPWRAHDQTFSVKAGMIQANQTSDLMTEVDGVGTLSFWARTSTAESASDAAFQLIVDGMLVAELSGQTNWTNIVHEITTYDFHDIVWRYTKGEFHGHENEDSAWIDEVRWTPGPPDPLPRVDTDSEVDEALEDSADANLAENITSKTEYNAYRAWVNRKGFEHQAAKDAHKSWLSYALDSSVLIDKRFRKDDLSIDLFTPYSAGGFLFELELNGVDIGDNATAANLAKIFGIEGASALDRNDFSSDNVTFSFGAPNDGKATIVAEPKDGNAESFFLRATMRDFYDDVPVVSLSLNGGGSLNGASDEILVDRDAEYGSLPTPTRTGHTFDGWFTKATGGTKVTGSTTITTNSSHVLYAHWTPNTYTITFDPNGGSVSQTSKTVTYGSTYGTLPWPYLNSHSFEGWFTEPYGGNNVSDSDVVGILSNATVYAHWNIITCAVTFDANGGSVSPGMKAVTYGEAYGELPVPVRADYTFAGWYTDYGELVTADTIVGISLSHDLHAQWASFQFSISEGEATITKWPNASGIINIPSGVAGCPVVTIGGSAFSSAKLTGVIIPDSVTRIHGYAFAGCNRLGRDKDLTLPEGLTYIGDNAFSGCNELSGTLTIPNSVTNVGSEAFGSCGFSGALVIPASVTSIGSGAFFSCKELTEVSIPSGITTIADSMLNSCIKVKSVTIPDTVTKIGNRAFYSCRALTKVTIPDGVTSIGQYAFHDCIGLGSVTIPDSVTSIGYGAFSYCTGLTRASVPVGLRQQIESNSVFNGCSSALVVSYY